MKNCSDLTLLRAEQGLSFFQQSEPSDIFDSVSHKKALPFFTFHTLFDLSDQK